MCPGSSVKASTDLLTASPKQESIWGLRSLWMTVQFLYAFETGRQLIVSPGEEKGGRIWIPLVLVDQCRVAVGVERQLEGHRWVAK